jgi:hypothetical protein
MDREKLKLLIKESAKSQNLKDFNFIISEAKNIDNKVSTGSGGDAAGKAFEIHVAKHIGHILRGGNDPEKHYPDHFSDESGDNPQASAQKQKERLGSHLYNQIDKHAKKMAYHIVNHMKKRGINLDHTSKVTWTSKPKDLERLTGMKGVKGTADVTVSHGGNHHGISLKYSASGTPPSLRSPGVDSLTSMLKADSNHVSNIVKEHDNSVDSAVGHLVGKGSKKEKHKKFKLLSQTGHPATKLALDASRSAHKQLASHYSDSFNKLDHKEKTNFVRKMIDAEDQPTIKPYRASYDANKNVSHVSNPTQDFDKIHSNTRHYSAESSGASFHIYAHHPDGSKTKVTSIGIKNKSSSPYTAITGRVSDNMKKSVVVRKKKKK